MTDQLDEILTRLLADVDDDMEFAGTMLNPPDNAREKVVESLAAAKAKLEALLIEARIEELKHLPKHQMKVGIIRRVIRGLSTYQFKDRLTTLQKQLEDLR